MNLSGNRPLVTVGIPTYNGSKFIASAIQSVLDQTYTNLELLIFDNHSTDETPVIVKDFESRDARVRLIRHPANIGYIRNFNLIAKEAAGEYVLLFADDDLYDKDYIHLLIEGFALQPDAVASMGSINLLSFEGEKLERLDNFEQARVSSSTGMSPAKRISRVIRYGHNREWAWGLMLGLFKKEVLGRHPFKADLVDPGAVFYREVIFEGDVVFDERAVFYKRLGGMSGGNNYLRPVTIQTKWRDFWDGFLELFYEVRAIFSSRLSFSAKWNVFFHFLSYRFFVLAKRIFLFGASFFVFILVKLPARKIKSLFRK
jgi:glycosyltransferase involved in cell wall biosynthesis